jgi:hypothetical protein
VDRMEIKLQVSGKCCVDKWFFYVENSVDKYCG